jgi:hypothetical protein
MVETRATVGSEIHPYSLSDEELYWIGRLVRATAEIEDIIKEHVCRLTELPMGAVTILLGRMPMSARLNIARAFAEARGILDDHKECFESDTFRGFIKCRNTVAHGALLGMSDRNEIVFEVQETQGVESDQVYVSAVGYRPGGFRWHAQLAEKAIPELEDRLKLKASREERRTQPLHPHAKAPRKGKQSQAPQPPPRSSGD